MKSLFILCICFYAVRCKPQDVSQNGNVEDLFPELLSGLNSDDKQLLVEDILVLSQQKSITCSSCISVFNLIKNSLAVGASSESMLVTAVRICTVSELISAPACEGYVKINLPIITYIFKNQPQASPQAFCSLVLQEPDGTPCKHFDDRFEWTVDLPPRRDHSRPKKNFKNHADDKLNIVFISDAHIDPRYEPGFLENCGNPLCCRNESIILDNEFYASLQERALTNSVHNKRKLLPAMQRALRAKDNSEWGKTTAGFWGHYGNCDSPIWVFDNILEQIVSNTPDIDLIYYTGDTVDHGMWKTDRRLVLEMITYVADKLHSTFGDIPVFPTLGNHDTHAPNQYAPNYVSRDDINDEWLYQRLPDIWSPWLSDRDAARTLRKGGYYTKLARPGLRVIALNSNVAFQFNWWLVFDPMALKRQLEWLTSTLAAAECAGERVHILSHVPSGSEMIYTWSREYNRIVNRFSHVIAAEFNGHSHNDEFKLFYDEDGNPINVAFNGGSMTTYIGNNVNYKIFYVDKQTYEAIDADTWIYNLTEANQTPHKTPNWFLEYSFTDTYHLSSLKPRDLDDLLRRMSCDQDLLDTYVRFFAKSGDAFLEQTCDQTCKLGYVCRALTTVLWDNRKCFEYLGTDGQSNL